MWSGYAAAAAAAAGDHALRVQWTALVQLSYINKFQDIFFKLGVKDPKGLEA